MPLTRSRTDEEVCVKQVREWACGDGPIDDWPHGWWIAPMFVAGCLFWVAFIYWITT